MLYMSGGGKGEGEGGRVATVTRDILLNTSGCATAGVRREREGKAAMYDGKRLK